MAKTGAPRHGSMQYWPRKRAQRPYARVRSHTQTKDAKILGFAGYKVGMTHVICTDNSSNSLTKGKDIRYPVTVIECPPLKVASVRFYKTKIKNLVLITEVLADKLDKELARKIKLPKNITKKIDDVKDFEEVRLLVYTQPKTTGVGKKKPEMFEVGIGGSKEDAIAYAKENLGKEIAVGDIFTEGQQIDIHAITKGKGYQGAVKRFSVNLRAKKSEKTKRGVGSLGPWCGQAHIMWRIPMAGKHGFFTRTENNKWLLKIGDKPEEVNVAGGYKQYGVVKSTYVLVKGSIAGPQKRLIRMNFPMRPNPKIPKSAPRINYISTTSNQGN